MVGTIPAPTGLGFYEKPPFCRIQYPTGIIQFHRLGEKATDIIGAVIHARFFPVDQPQPIIRFDKVLTAQIRMNQAVGLEKMPLLILPGLISLSPNPSNFRLNRLRHLPSAPARVPGNPNLESAVYPESTCPPRFRRPAPAPCRSTSPAGRRMRRGPPKHIGRQTKDFQHVWAPGSETAPGSVTHFG